MADNLTTNPGAGGATIATDDVGGVHYPISKLAFGALDSATLVSNANGLPSTLINSAGSAIASLALGTASEGLLTSAGATDFFFSTANATTTQLAAGATFTGVVESIVSAQAWSILLTSDRAGTLTLVEYIDAAGTRPTSTKVVPIAAGVPFSRAYTANGNFFRLTFQNTSGLATTTLSINTAFGILPAVTNLGNVPVALSEINGTAISLGQGTMVASIPVVLPSNQSAISVTLTGNTPTLGAGSNLAADVGIQHRATATGGASASNFVAGATTNATVIKGSAGRLLGVHMTNNALTVRYVKFHNQSTSPTAGTGVVQTYGVPPNGGTISITLPGGLGFGSGIALTTVTGAAAADTTAVAANDLVGTIIFA